MAERERIHAVVFDHPDRTVAAVRALREAGFAIVDVHTPFAVHGLDEAMGLRETRLPWATFVGGALGATAAFGLQIWTHAVDWPLNIGGKSNVAWPALVPVGFELTVLFAAFATVGALLVRGKLRPVLDGSRPSGQPHRGVTDDRFVVLVGERDASFAPDRFQSLCRDLGAMEVREGWRVA